MQINYEDEDKVEVSMSPLIDCVFLLLIFLLVATMSKKADKDVDIRLPESKSSSTPGSSNKTPISTAANLQQGILVGRSKRPD